ncbi:hypothetical protein GCM10027515_25580 [Schumannella luteola]|uniref:Arginyl-tRNA synthetase n=1 Tax=Schumannella luteola TaxID=472059 RepID=A0A852YEB8_9MICO|nr:hypothetical protein [Schumannella luteola]NYG99644.1 hypothetical protein [Schumannella luteola]TPX02038.1 hypothetical protein FJ656_24770 [Schumannella luteola]
MSRSLRTAALAASAGAALLLLAACTPAGDSDASPKPTTSRSASPSASSSPSGSPSPSVSPTATPVDVSCSKLVSAQTVYDFNPNYVLLTKPSIPAGSAAAQAQADGGVACAWQQTTTGHVIYLSAARYPADKIEQLKAAAGPTTTAFGAGSGYWSGTTGTAFAGDAWIVATSVDFYEAADASTFIDSAAAALG